MKYAIALSVAFAALTAAANAAEVQALASFSILGDIVSRVGGERVTVTTIVGPNADTHVYEPTPTDARTLYAASIFFVNGLGFEGWMDRLVEATGYAGPVVVASDGAAIREMDEDGEMITDPHAWQSLSNGLIYVDNVRKGLCAVDPPGCASYEANAAAYSEEIRTLDAGVKAQIATVPEMRRKVITTHDAFGYFGEAYGVMFLAAEGISTDSEASAADVAKLIDQVREAELSALFIENMSDPRLTEQIGDETGVSLGGELYADALSEDDQDAPAYLDMFRHNVGLLVPAMKGD